MASLANMIGRVMMGVSFPRKSDAALKTWAEIEYRKDSEYVYDRLSKGKSPDLR